MSHKLLEALKVVKQEKCSILEKNSEYSKLFRNKINLLISKTPTGELREGLTDLNIIFESMLNNNEMLIKNE